MPEQPLYDKLAASARAFVEAPNPPDHDSSEVDSDRVLDTLAPGAHVRWGHDLFVSTKPPLQGEKSRKSFLEHMKGMSQFMENVESQIVATNVDVDKRSVVMRVKFTMTVKGHEQDPVPNDVLFWMMLNNDGDQVKDVTEFIDPVAGNKIAKMVQEYRETSGQES